MIDKTTPPLPTLAAALLMLGAGLSTPALSAPTTTCRICLLLKLASRLEEWVENIT